MHLCGLTYSQLVQSRSQHEAEEVIASSDLALQNRYIDFRARIIQSIDCELQPPKYVP